MSEEMQGTAQEHRHCWHGTGQAHLSFPPQLERVCCWCGEKVWGMPTPPVILGHGQHEPEEVVWRRTTGIVPPANDPPGPPEAP